MGMTVRKITGAVFIGVGALNILNFWAPAPIPTAGPLAFLIGALFIGTGLFIRAPRDGSGRVEWHRLGALLGPGKSDSPIGPGSRAERRTETTRPVDPKLPVRVLRLAAESGGVLSISQAAMGLDVPLDDAQAALDECAMKGTAYIQVDEEKIGRASCRERV